MYIPLNYEQLNIIDGSWQPSAVKHNSAAYGYWVRSLMQRAASVFEWTLPDTWQGKTKDFFIYCLLRFGYVAIFRRKEFGLIFQPATLNGIDLFYQPTNALICNPAIPESLDLKIGTDCELLKLTPDYIGLWPVVDYYAAKLATLDGAIDMSLINNKFAFMLAAKNKTAAAALKKMIDKVNSGEPAVIVDLKVLNDDSDKDVPWQSWQRDRLKENYLTSDQLKDRQTILNAFDNEIGIPTVPYQKQERMTDYESRSRVLDASARLSVWMDTLKSSIREVKKLFPEITLDVRYRYEDETKEGDEDGDDDLVRTL